MTIGDANDINTVLRYLYGLSGYTRMPTADEANNAAERLATRANKSLGAGLSGADIRVVKSRLTSAARGWSD